MKTFKLIIAPVNDPTKESIVTVIAKDAGEALVINSVERPGTYVKKVLS